MSLIPTVYSLRDLVGVFEHPKTGPYVFSGEEGVGQISITMDTTRSVIDVAGDGGIMASALPGDNGTVEIEIQQTAPLQAFLIGWTSYLYAAQALGDVSTWAAATISFRNIVDGSMHTCIGVMPTKAPTKVYGAQGAKLTWTLMACNIINA